MNLSLCSYNFLGHRGECILFYEGKPPEGYKPLVTYEIPRELEVLNERVGFNGFTIMKYYGSNYVDKKSPVPRYIALFPNRNTKIDLEYILTQLK
ncbi:MAG: hypothetical protein QXE31_06155 [Candidatus Woesearchaeota archaeon]